MEEIWKDIKEYEGRYQISNFGRVKSLIYHKEKIMNIYNFRRDGEKGNGYLKVRLSKNKIVRNYYIHRLVAQTFLDNPNNYKYINHKDENKQNNNVYNLEWCTQKYNVNYGTGLSRKNYKNICKSRKKVCQYDLQGNFIKQWKSIKEIHDTLNLSLGNISYCCHGKRNKTGGYICKFYEEKEVSK